MEEIVKHINDTNASFRSIGAGNAKNTDLFLDSDQYELFRDAGEQITVRFNKENLQKAILFIASILPRKYDNSAVHRIQSFSSSFVFDQLALLDAFFTVDGKIVDTRTQVWNARKDVLQNNGDIDKRFYFNGLLEEIAYTTYNGEQRTAKFTIRNYLAGGYSDLHIKKTNNGIFDVWITNTYEYKDDGKERRYEKKDSSSQRALQQIFYGAPGTGKSYEIKKLTLDKEVIRTTFHPDSDYSTFVGAYKPTSIEVPLRDLAGHIVNEETTKKPVTDNRIIYEFVEQAFLQAYIKAWKAYTQIAAGEQPAEQYLVIEEINRGNCAQIFGDLFQLLDRNRDGFSEYPITADKDMKKQLEKTFKGLEIADAERINKYYDKDMVSKVLSGEVLLLPDNLYIWATMNTSDQSLFPIDSAFKRRWEWKYIPISEGKTETGEKLGYKILIKGKKYDWWTFLNKINDEIEDTTKSEDKKLGYFFCKANDGIIDADTFVSKVVFYLWNDVFKDQDASIFSDDEGEMTFSKFYDTDIFGKPFVKEDKVVLLLQNLKVEPLSEDVVFDSDDDTASEEQESIRKESIISIQIPNNPKILAAETTQFDSFVKALKVIGIERILPLVDTLKYQRLNCPVISTIKYPAVENNEKGYSYYQEGALFIVKGCKSYTYVRILEDLNKALNIGLSIETK